MVGEYIYIHLHIYIWLLAESYEIVVGVWCVDCYLVVCVC